MKRSIPTKCPDCEGKVRVYAEMDVEVPEGTIKKTFAKCWSCRRRWVKSVLGTTGVLLSGYKQ